MVTEIEFRIPKTNNEETNTNFDTNVTEIR